MPSSRTPSRIFDGLDGNDEIPAFVAVDPFDSIYVTGAGGPAVTLDNGSRYLRMVTLKYSATGEPAWMTGSAAAVFTGFSYKASLSWTDRCSGAGCTAYAKIGRTLGDDATTFEDFAVLVGSTYSYRVVAHGFTGDSAASNGAQATMGSAEALTSAAPTPDAAPAAPAHLIATALSSSRIVLQWTNGSSTQTAIAIERCSGRCRSYSEIARVAGSAASFTDGGLAARTSYTYRVRAFNGTVSSPYSASVTAKTPR